MRKDRSMLVLTTITSVVSTFFTATFMPWAIAISKSSIQTRVDVAVIKEKLHISKEDYEAFSKTPAAHDESLAFPALPFLPKTKE